ncbi:hypothetical protein DAPPUDRAFT_240975 [Daphnia pulex]|uniref:Small ribosomal subunit protein mS35 mitochondrial conserved domain-containing protein n=1 Tax=Daphnia pulex TaxID=6669 RepID=E9GD38_DAPPU|nr:hypothetical protein DAPPUDRAFT_240975 [Daphnia pulex]|eukprot:EFX82761.1 hypothetical protein DAPPUDRAFT_240975 [Daphnia pulex]
MAAVLRDHEFRSLDLSSNKSLNMRPHGRKVYKRATVHPPCSTKMPTDQDWPSVWPVARSFHSASVPLPLHQGWLKLSSLKLDNHAKDKLLRLVKERYNPEFDVLTIVSERCPLRKQNVDYAMYLLNVLVSESWKTVPWENEKCEADMEKYVSEGSQSQRTVDESTDDREKSRDIPEPGGHRTVREKRCPLPIEGLSCIVRVVAVRCGTLLQPMLVKALIA